MMIALKLINIKSCVQVKSLIQDVFLMNNIGNETEIRETSDAIVHGDLINLFLNFVTSFIEVIRNKLDITWKIRAIFIDGWIVPGPSYLPSPSKSVKDSNNPFVPLS